jgi:small nuclear ribonucleoprotein (snRNP)-like protein
MRSPIVTNLARLLDEIHNQETTMKGLKSLALVLTLIVVPLAQVAHPQAHGVDNAARIKSEVAKRLANKKTRVKIKLVTGEELKGRLDRADDSAFTVIDDETGRKVDVAYNAVEKLSGRAAYRPPRRSVSLPGWLSSWLGL